MATLMFMMKLRQIFKDEEKKMEGRTDYQPGCFGTPKLQGIPKPKAHLVSAR